jgi:hypothetical protein
MAIPTVAEIIAEIQDLLGDPNAKVITSAVATKGFQRAYRRLRAAMLNRQLPFVKKVVTHTLAANTTSLTPATAGITDFGELIRMEEKADGSSEDYTLITEVEELPQTEAGDRLGVVEWRQDTWYFVGATTGRALKITYYDNAAPPSSGSVGIDGSFAFLSYYGAAEAGRTKQYDAEADRFMMRAVGSVMDEGDQESGELLRLVRAMVRSLQRTPIQPKPYSVGRTFKKQPNILHIAAPISEGALSYLTISGTQNGVNAVFTLSSNPTGAVIIVLNGVTLSPGVGYTRAGQIITFAPAYIPQADDTILAYT